MSPSHGSGPVADHSAVESAAKQIAWGSIAGMLGELFDYPFDLAKVRLQAQLLTPPADPRQRFDGPLHCLTRTFTDEGLRGLYRGLPLPLIGATVDTGVIFYTYSTFQNLIRNVWTSRYDTLAHQPPLSLSLLTLAAACSGFVHSFIVTPIELVKCKMQVQMLNTHYLPPNAQVSGPQASPARPRKLSTFPSGSASPAAAARLPSFNFFSNAHPSALVLAPSPSAYEAALSRAPPGPLAIIRATLDTHGVRGLYLGHVGTLVRETGGTAIWFAVKEACAKALLASRSTPGAPREERLKAWESAFAGALAGAAGVIALYPVDTVKNAMQTQEELSSRAPHRLPRISNSFWQTSLRMFRAHGWSGLYAGCGMTVARTVPSSGIVFVVYDQLCAWFGS